MFDFFLHTREKMIANLQAALRSVRQVLDLSAQELGDLIGVTRQTVNNLETGKTPMSPTQYIAIAAVLDKVLEEKPELYPALIAVIQSAGHSAQDSLAGEIINVHNGSFLKKWFMCFPDTGFIGHTLEELPLLNEDTLKAIARNYKIFVNYDSLLAENSQGFFEQFAPILKEHGNRLIVPMLVVETLQNMLLVPEPSQASRAREGLALLADLQARDVIQIRGEQTDKTISSLLISVFAKHKRNYRLLLITQDQLLAQDILSLNRKQSLPGFSIVCCYLGGEGCLKVYNEQDGNQGGEFQYLKDEQQEYQIE